MGKLYRVDIKLQGQTTVERYDIPSADTACALGIALDELEADLDEEPKVEWVTVVVDPHLAARQPRAWDAMPAQIRDAMARAVDAERATA